jgi:histidinol-phosphate aminotransferase
VNSAAMVAALATLEDLASAQANVDSLISERERLIESLDALPWLSPLPSDGNFILCGVRGQGGNQVAEALTERGILVRSFSDPRLHEYVRISIGRPEQNEELVQALRSL